MAEHRIDPSLWVVSVKPFGLVGRLRGPALIAPVKHAIVSLTTDTPVAATALAEKED